MVLPKKKFLTLKEKINLNKWMKWVHSCDVQRKNQEIQSTMMDAQAFEFSERIIDCPGKLKYIRLLGQVKYQQYVLKTIQLPIKTSRCPNLFQCTSISIYTCFDVIGDNELVFYYLHWIHMPPLLICIHLSWLVLLNMQLQQLFR